MLESNTYYRLEPFWNSLTKGHILIASGQVPKTSITPFILGISYFLLFRKEHIATSKFLAIFVLTTVR